MLQFLIFTCLTFKGSNTYCFMCVKKLWVKCIYIFWQGKIISVFFWWRTFENVRFFLFGVQWRCIAILQVFLMFFSIADAMWKIGDFKLLKPAHGHSDVLCLCDRLRRSGFAHLYNEKSTCLMQVFFLVSDRLFSDHCEWSASGSTLDVEQVCSGVGFYSLQVRNGKVSTRW